MKKFLVVVLAVAFLAMASVPLYAGTLRRTIIDSVTLDDDPTAVTSSVVNVEQADSVGFFLDYDETEVGLSISLAVTIEISYDGTTWIAGSFFDLAGGPATFVTTETLTSDGTYFFWLHADSNISRVRVVATATNTDADDIAVIDCFVVVNQ
ncbi:MAG TPA: hypothetical protein ENH85_13610 [Candidatus Scalindua sp.]|nr:hypothetical protein [Candidatus Scalindua sp.]